MDINKVTLIGRLVSDPTVHKTHTSFVLATSGVPYAVGKSAPRRTEPDLHDITATGRMGAIVAKYLTKGSRVRVEGRAQTRTYEYGGQTHRMNYVQADQLILLARGT